jgi:hypothetical protein
MPPPLPTVCVVIPVYQTALTQAEQAAFDRCIAILHRHAIFIAKPASLNVSSLTGQHPDIQVEPFPDDFFNGINGYNKLMLSDFFYARFADFQYMLIYQLDAFVFSDQLLAWCERGYDYIGAPWLPRATMPTALDKLRTLLKQRVYRWLDRQDRCGCGAHHTQYDYVAGNGGLSLRRVAAMRQALHKYERRAQRYRARAHHTHNEDIFFTVEVNRYRQFINLPPLRTAVAFSWESHPSLARQLNSGALPFGCHAWDKLYRDDWRPIFKQFGYSLDSLLDQRQAELST